MMLDPTSLVFRGGQKPDAPGFYVGRPNAGIHTDTDVVVVEVRADGAVGREFSVYITGSSERYGIADFEWIAWLFPERIGRE